MKYCLVIKAEMSYQEGQKKTWKKFKCILLSEEMMQIATYDSYCLQQYSRKSPFGSNPKSMEMLYDGVQTTVPANVPVDSINYWTHE